MKEVETEFLIEEEIQCIYTKKFRTPRLELVRDIFIFCCFTGLAYVDVKGLRNDYIGIGIGGQKWIFKNRQKTDTKSKIPLLATSSPITLIKACCNLHLSLIEALKSKASAQMWSLCSA